MRHHVRSVSVSVYLASIVLERLYVHNSELRGPLRTKSYISRSSDVICVGHSSSIRFVLSAFKATGQQTGVTRAGRARAVAKDAQAPLCCTTNLFSSIPHRVEIAGVPADSKNQIGLLTPASVRALWTTSRH